MTERGTFEERVGRALDDLYPGALFLARGDEAHAERILTATLERASRGSHARPPGTDWGGWFEALLAGEALRFGEPAGEAAAGGAPLPAAAQAIPVRARVALWLVVFRRWGYREAGELMGESREGVVDLLAFRHTLMTALMGEDPQGSGTDGVAHS
jgi:DNA-directed RNA polymerase specialized sigma24 family protein